MIITLILFAAGLLLLIEGGDWFVDGATGIAYRFHVPELLVGATIVSIGTTLPEVMVSANSAISGHPEIAYGNAIGSIICNTSLIAALTISLVPGTAHRKTLKLPVLFFFGSASFYMLVAYTTGYFSRVIGGILLTIFAAYIAMSIRSALTDQYTEPLREDTPKHHIAKDAISLVVGAAAIAFGADLLVDNATIIAQALHVPESVIALTIVALGTSLPELVTAITSLLKGHSSLSLGNIIGANLFNLVLVSGAAASLAPFSIPVTRTVLGINSTLIVDLPVMIFVMAVLIIPTMLTGYLKRSQGILLLVTYAAFCVYQCIG